MNARSQSRGFTLLEVLVATLLMAVAVAGLMGAISTAMRHTARLTDHDRAVQLARQKMDELLITTGLPKGIPIEGTWGPEVTGGAPLGWRARLAPFELPQSKAPGQPFVERVELEIWGMAGTERRAFRLEGFYRAVLTKVDLLAAGAAIPAPDGVPVQ